MDHLLSPNIIFVIAQQNTAGSTDANVWRLNALQHQ